MLPPINEQPFSLQASESPFMMGSMTASSASPVTMNAVDTETNIIQYFVAGSNDIPENILD